MSRSRLCRACKDFHDLDEAWPAACYGHFGIAGDAQAGPQIISDTIEPFRHMGTGTVYSSKSRYRQDLRAQGYIEVGNSHVEQRAAPPPPVRDTLRRVYHDLTRD